MNPPTVFIPILFVFCLCRVSWGLRPFLRPNVTEKVINTGETINFECIHTSKLYFYYPQYMYNEQLTIISEAEAVTFEDGRYRYAFSRRDALPSDTGWYGCARHAVKFTWDIFTDPEFSWIYFYVASSDQLLIDEGKIQIFYQKENNSLTVPCRPTSPDVEVEAFVVEEREEIFFGDNETFNPKYGFTYDFVRMTTPKFFYCVAKENDVEHRSHYFFKVNSNSETYEPEIDNNAIASVMRGEDVHVNCTSRVKPGVEFILDWLTPFRSSRITTKSYINEINKNTNEVIRELTIKNVTEEDDGEYSCYFKSYGFQGTSDTYLKVLDPKQKYITLYPQNKLLHYEAESGGKITWFVKYDAYPIPELTWFHPDGNEIVPGWSDVKYALNTEIWSTTLTIYPLEIWDMGVYQLRATIEDTLTETLNFTLVVFGKPVLWLTNIQEYYAPGENAYAECEVYAYPEPDITWGFLRCPNYPSLEGSSYIELKSETKKTEPYAFYSEGRMKIDISGIINCTACNSIGCDYVFELILVSDGNGDFGILQLEEQIAEGDSISIVCAVSVYNYTGNITWSKGDKYIPILDNGSIMIVKEKTPFTYRSTLYIDKVRREDTDIYTCFAETTDKTFRRIEYDLFVHDQRPTIFTNSSLKGRDLSIDLSQERYNTIILMCYVDGMPKPNVTWYKDGVLLNHGIKDQYVFLNHNQELHINFLLEKDGGKYTCRAKNRLNTIEDFINIVIKGKELSKGLISLIVILSIIVVIFVIYFIVKVRRDKILRKELSEIGLTNFEEGALDLLNPALTVDDQAELLPYDKKWEFPRERLKLGKQLGHGAFGVVMKAVAQGIREDETVTTVAVKMLRRTTEPIYVRALASELKIMVHLGKHLNVMNLLGACTKNISKRELLVIVEYCRFGNLHNYLLRHRKDFVNQMDPATDKYDFLIGIDRLMRTASFSSTNSISANSETMMIPYVANNTSDPLEVTMSPEGSIFGNNSSQPDWRSNYRGDYKDQNLKPICTQDLLSWAFQVARGMEYLSQRKVLHGDLAARNILLAEDNVVKICDFGLAKTMYKDDNYKKKGNEPLPIKWMAIESIRDRIFSTQSDVWSFGILLWEFFSLAVTPYPGMSAEKLYEKLIDGYRMEKPTYSINKVYEIMLQCWKIQPVLRPTFTELVDDIGDLLEENVKAHYISMNAPYMDLNTKILKGKEDYLTMMSAPDHVALSSSTQENMNSPNIDHVPGSTYLSMRSMNSIKESGIPSTRSNPENLSFVSPSMTSDAEDAVEISPKLKYEEDPCLNPINIHEPKIEFAQQRQASKNLEIDSSYDRDSGYSNEPRSLNLIDLNVKQADLDDPLEEQSRTETSSETEPYTSKIIETPNNDVL